MGDDGVMIVGPIRLEGYRDRSSKEMMWFFVVGCRIDQAGIARPVQPNKQPNYIIIFDLIQRKVKHYGPCPSIFERVFSFGGFVGIKNGELRMDLIHALWHNARMHWINIEAFCKA